MSGIIYVLSHKAIPDLLKIGFTTRSIEERVQELSSTGVPGKYTVELYFQTDDAAQFEMLLHRILREFRYEKEFFKVDIQTVISAVHSLIKENKLNLYKFNGSSSHLAATKEQIAEDRRIRNEKQNRIDEQAKQLRDKYLHKTYEELRREFLRLNCDPLPVSQYESKQVLKMMRLKQNQENKLKEIEHQKNLIIFEDKFADRLANLGLRVNHLLNQTAKPKLFLVIRGYSYEDGKRLAVRLKQEDKQLITDFLNIFKTVQNLFWTEFIFSHLGIPEHEQNLIIRHDKKEFSEYFKGIVSILDNS